jgi:Leucine-rich repeat (LRR) protein
VPENVTLFPGLDTIGLYGNQISALPPLIFQLSNLKSLHIDYNPIKTLQPVNNLIKKLKVLSIKKTEIPATEIAALNQMFPDCKIQTE